MVSKALIIEHVIILYNINQANNQSSWLIISQQALFDYGPMLKNRNTYDRKEFSCRKTYFAQCHVE